MEFVPPVVEIQSGVGRNILDDVHRVRDPQEITTPSGCAPKKSRCTSGS